MEDEKWQEFFQEFGDLLNKYKFMISDFKLGSSKYEGTKVIRFDSDGSRVFPIYFVPGLGAVDYNETEIKDGYND